MRWLIFVVLILGGCSLKPELQDDSITNKFLITLPKIEHKSKNKIDKTVKISLPVAQRYLHTYDITYTKGDGVFGSYLYNFWDETPVKQFQFLLSHTLSKSEIFPNIIIGPSQITNDLTLESRIDALWYNSKKEKVSLHVTLFLVNSISKKVIKSRAFKIDQDVPYENPRGVVIGFNKAVQTLSLQIISWLEEN